MLLSCTRHAHLVFSYRNTTEISEASRRCSMSVQGVQLAFTMPVEVSPCKPLPRGGLLKKGGRGTMALNHHLLLGYLTLQ